MSPHPGVVLILITTSHHFVPEPEPEPEPDSLMRRAI
jgi:hypothetical protein